MASLNKVAQSRYNDLLIAELLGKSRAHILAHPEIKLTAEQQKKLQSMQKQLVSGMPLAYVLKHKWFYGNRFIVNQNVLIPRPETELLVGVALDWAKKNKPGLIADIGTGSGIIIISLRHLINAAAGAKFLAVDISRQALKVAELNARLLVNAKYGKNEKTKIKFLYGNLTTPLEKYITAQNFRNILLAANLPYLSVKELCQPTIKHEPKLALWGGRESFTLVSKLIKQLAQLQKKHAKEFKNSAIFLEINYNQFAQAQRAIKKYLPAAGVSMHKDFGGFPRVVQIIFE